MNCSVTFYPSYCILQDLHTRKTITNGKLCGGLYYWKQRTITSMASPILSETHSSSSIQQLKRWHQRLGHSTFGVMEKMLPNLVKRCNWADFVCDIYEYAKHKRASYPVIIIKAINYL